MAGGTVTTQALKPFEGVGSNLSMSRTVEKAGDPRTAYGDAAGRKGLRVNARFWCWVRIIQFEPCLSSMELSMAAMSPCHWRRVLQFKRCKSLARLSESLFQLSMLALDCRLPARPNTNPQRHWFGQVGMWGSGVGHGAS